MQREVWLAEDKQFKTSKIGWPCLTGVNQESGDEKVGEELGMPAQSTLGADSRDLLPTVWAGLYHQVRGMLYWLTDWDSEDFSLLSRDRVPKLKGTVGRLDVLSLGSLFFFKGDFKSQKTAPKMAYLLSLQNEKLPESKFLGGKEEATLLFWV